MHTKHEAGPVPPRARSLVLALAFLAALAACGGDDGGSDDPGGGAVTCNAGSRVDIGASNGSPACVRVTPGGTITIANGRAAAIEVRSHPHPTHGSCPELDVTPAIPPGGSIDVVMVTVGSCGYHDHATGTPLGVIQVGSGPAPSDPYDPDPA
jgi:hypothetical protein